MSESLEEELRRLTELVMFATDVRLTIACLPEAEFQPDPVVGPLTEEEP